MARLDYYAPGVYIEEVNRGSRPIEGVPTAVGGFVGFTEDIRGGAEPFKPMLVTTWDQYLQYFGRPNSDGFTDFGAYLPLSVYGWFLNGGGRCWIVSIGTRLPGSPEPEATETGTSITNRGNRPSLKFSIRPGSDLTTTGDSGSSLVPVDRSVRVQIMEGEPKPPPEEAEASSTTLTANTGEFFTVVVAQGDEELERFENLTMNSQIETSVADYVVTALEESEYIAAIDLSISGSPLARKPSNGVYEISPPLVMPPPDRFSQHIEGVRDDRTGVRGLFEIDEVTIMACPDLMKVYEAGLINIDQLHGIMDVMVSLCEGAADGDIPNAPNRMVILDPPPDRVKPQEISRWLREEFNRRSQFAALYYPWIRVPNPRNAGRPVAIPPSGYMAGVWSRTDETRGVYKAPANEVPRGVMGLAYDCNFREQELLNPAGINCIRPFPSRGIRVWGARTLVEPDNIQWRYINVRRLMSYIEKSIENGMQWVVFEPNDEDLWQRVKRTITSFLTDLWRSGALMGGSPNEAFYVKCDADINTPQSMMLGRLYVEVGIAPVRPAEFVIFRISQWTAEGEG
ncbi:phage tail sheath C-terminal domain-containing protein [Roseofilum sp. BLCC_M91]|uniref:Phage tail sheath C-terminal domain-containing protein n=1 Tax=Roseofilum halophilum BLCC-M91 TaxID=3022259 RepID=A0ABT7BE59_9CYAN|nr:phage tail sheath C-terminal domain-containing protein [Roseofilum halophilum]MDJ1177461.1 phage tail sheath C-terminal domain-containing protein [Roseofilum halophilum BLCC-M91]